MQVRFPPDDERNRSDGADPTYTFGYQSTKITTEERTDNCQTPSKVLVPTTIPTHPLIFAQTNRNRRLACYCLGPSAPCCLCSSRSVSNGDMWTNLDTTAIRRALSVAQSQFSVSSVCPVHSSQYGLLLRTSSRVTRNARLDAFR